MRILDTTLRDGRMSQNVVLTLNDKIKIASLLDLAGIEIIEIAHIHGKDFREELTVGNEITDGKVSLADEEQVKKALGLDRVKNPLPCGYLKMYTGDDKIEIPVNLNSNFIIGPEGRI